MSEELETPIEITEDDKLWALLSWLFAPLIPIIVLLLEDKKDRPFVRYHAIQALIVGILAVVISSIIGVPTLGFGCLISPLIWVYEIYLAIQAYNGNWVEVPVITDFAKKQGWL